ALLPEPVMPSNVWNRSPPWMPSASCSMAFGWSPAGPNGETTSKRALLFPPVVDRALGGRCAGSVAMPEAYGGGMTTEPGSGRGGPARPGPQILDPGPGPLDRPVEVGRGPRVVDH